MNVELILSATDGKIKEEKEEESEDKMDRGIVRIEEITIRNFKNVKYGRITLKNNRKNYKASVLGLYGQNGTGKTALIDAMALLKFALCGMKVPSTYADYINIESEYATMIFKFAVEMPEKEENYTVIYEFDLKKELADESKNVSENESIDEEQKKYKAAIANEVLSARAEGEKHRMSQIINTNTKAVFVPKSRYKEFIGEDQDVMMNLLVDKRYTYQDSRSFLFSREFLSVIRKHSQEDNYTSLLNRLVNYGHYELFIIKTKNTGLITLNALPLSFMYEGEKIGASGNFVLPIDRPQTLPDKIVVLTKKMLPHMNEVLSQIVPGLTISLHDFGLQILENGEKGHKVQLMSRKNSKEIPLRDESDGIKKIVSILQLLIMIYNRQSITVAIDELDSGLFEYLLGELLKIISEEGKGQLIFTSHNLRPLETIDRGFVAFTTTNPENRYIRLTNVKDNNNLRDFYYRDIILGSQKEDLYDLTNNYKISLAFKKAGGM